MVLDDDMDALNWIEPVNESGVTVHDGATAFATNDNDLFWIGQADSDE